MLKLLGNTLGSYGTLIDNNGDKICWKYIVELQKLQDDISRRLYSVFSLLFENKSVSDFGPILFNILNIIFALAFFLSADSGSQSNVCKAIV